MPSDMGAEFARNSDSLKGMVAALPCDLHGPPGNLAMRPPGENGMPDDEDTPPASLLRDAAGLFAAACAREPGRMPPEEIPKTLMACFAARPPAMRMPWNGWWTPTRAAAFCSRTWAGQAPLLRLSAACAGGFPPGPHTSHAARLPPCGNQCPRSGGMAGGGLCSCGFRRMARGWLTWRPARTAVTRPFGGRGAGGALAAPAPYRAAAGPVPFRLRCASGGRATGEDAPPWPRHDRTQRAARHLRIS